MVLLEKLTNYLDKLLLLENFSNDSSNNGLQVQGKPTIKKSVFSVDASLQLFEEAAEKKADFIFVHHGISWGDNLKRLTDLNAKRLKVLFEHEISLYAAHLPLDAHPTLGHNGCIAKILKLRNKQMFGTYSGYKIGIKGTLPRPLPPGKIGKLLDKQLGSTHKILGTANKAVKKIGIISGGGADMVTDALKEHLDLFITGESGHSTYHWLKESGLPTLLLGHYYSEKPGIIAIMDHIQSSLKIDCEFIDLPTGM